jgi:hypothetical protein
MGKGQKSQLRIKDMIGQKHNRLTVVSKSKKPHTKGDSSAMWNCICDCGKNVIVSRRSLMSSRSMSCGCLRLELNRKKAKERRKPGIYSPLRRMYRSYKWNAKKGSLNFELSLEQFYEFTQKICYWCETVPLQQLKTIRGNDSSHILIYNGIDRLNSDLGYSLGNCVPCCGICNKMKMDLSVSDFLKSIEKIYLCNKKRLLS